MHVRVCSLEIRPPTVLQSQPYEDIYRDNFLFADIFCLRVCQTMEFIMVLWPATPCKPTYTWTDSSPHTHARTREHQSDIISGRAHTWKKGKSVKPWGTKKGEKKGLRGWGSITALWCRVIMVERAKNFPSVTMCTLSWMQGKIEYCTYVNSILDSAWYPRKILMIPVGAHLHDLLSIAHMMTSAYFPSLLALILIKSHMAVAYFYGKLYVVSTVYRNTSMCVCLWSINCSKRHKRRPKILYEHWTTLFLFQLCAERTNVNFGSRLICQWQRGISHLVPAMMKWMHFRPQSSAIDRGFPKKWIWS